MRGKEFGVSRVVRNMAWLSDVAAGRMMGVPTVARLHSDEEFLMDLEAAKRKFANKGRQAIMKVLKGVLYVLLVVLFACQAQAFVASLYGWKGKVAL